MRWSRIILAVTCSPSRGRRRRCADKPARAGRHQKTIPIAIPIVYQPDFTIVNLPTTLRLPRFKSAFRVTHRFGRPLGAGDFGDLAGDLFGLDSGAQIGLEYRFGMMRGVQVGIHRTSNKTIEFFGQYSVLQQRRQRAGRARRVRARSTARTTSATATRPRSASSYRASSAATARSMSSRCGSTTATRCRAN